MGRVKHRASSPALESRRLFRATGESSMWSAPYFPEQLQWPQRHVPHWQRFDVFDMSTSLPADPAPAFNPITWDGAEHYRRGGNGDAGPSSAPSTTCGGVMPTHPVR